MSGAMRKMGVYLGLLEDAEGRYETADLHGNSEHDEPTQATAVERTRNVSSISERRRHGGGEAGRPGAQHTAPSAGATAAAPMSRITTLHPRTYNEARVIGENFRDGVPVIMDLSEMSDEDAKRLVDFAAGLVFSVRGSIERVTRKVFLLSPPHVTVSAEEKERAAEGGFFNQS